MKFRASFCDPFQKAIIEMGEIEKDKIIETFEKTDWADFLKRMEGKPDSEVFYSPSLEIENIENKNGLSISAIEEGETYGFGIFYKRPAKHKPGLFRSNEVLTEIWDQNADDVVKCLNALINNDLEFLENAIQ